MFAHERNKAEQFRVPTLRIVSPGENPSPTLNFAFVGHDRFLDRLGPSGGRGREDPKGKYYF
jgi:hypothetical protein